MEEEIFITHYNTSKRKKPNYSVCVCACAYVYVRVCVRACVLVGLIRNNG